MSNTQPQKVLQNRRPARRANRRNQNRSVPLARGRNNRTNRTTRMKVFHDSNQSISLAGTDMFQLQSDKANGFHMTCNILANPLYWYGTRIAGIAKVYQKFRPRHLRFRYVPNCPATSSGSVTIGVIEAGVTLSPETAVTTLLNSGGKNINIFQSDAIDYYPKLKEPCYIDGDIAKPVVNPFTFCMYTLKNADVPPGIIYIDWEYDFLQGSGDQQFPIAVITSVTEAQKRLLLSTNSDLYNEHVLSFGWGTVLGFLKTVGVPILRKIGIVVCESVLAWLSDDSKSNAVMTNTVIIRDASFLTIDPSDVYTSPDGKTRVKDANGSDYYLPDTARVAVYMAGDAIQKPKAALPPVSNPKLALSLVPELIDGIDVSELVHLTNAQVGNLPGLTADAPVYGGAFNVVEKLDATHFVYWNISVLLSQKDDELNIYAVTWTFKNGGSANGPFTDTDTSRQFLKFVVLYNEQVLNTMSVYGDQGTTADNKFNAGGNWNGIPWAKKLYDQCDDDNMKAAWDPIKDLLK